MNSRERFLKIIDFHPSVDTREVSGKIRTFIEALKDGKEARDFYPVCVTICSKLVLHPIIFINYLPCYKIALCLVM